MLVAVMRHPAMPQYLANSTSIGPNSAFGRKHQRGRNEYLARECLELHSVSPAAGYTQADGVIAFRRGRRVGSLPCNSWHLIPALTASWRRSSQVTSSRVTRHQEM